MEELFFKDLTGIRNTLVVGALAYFGLVSLLRITGNRTLSKMNAFDLIVTVALGSTLSSIMILEDVTLAKGMTALAVLIGLQFAITWSSVRIRWVRHLVTGDPALLVYRGEFLRGSMRSQRVAEDEILCAVRSSGISRIESVQAVVLETDGSFSVIGDAEGNAGEALSRLHSSDMSSTV